MVKATLRAIFVSAVFALSMPSHAALDKAAVEAAKKEGAVVLYSAASADATSKICNAFRSKYGISCEYFSASALQLFQRFNAEADANNVKADLITASLLPAFNEAKSRGRITPFTSSEGSAFPAQFRDKDNYYVAGRVIVEGIAINPKLIAAGTAPKTWTDLLDPKWSGKLIASDPGASGTGLAAFYFLERKYGLDFIRKLAANKPLIVNSSALVANSVVSGERPVAAQLDSWEIAMRMKDSLPIAPIFPADGSPVVPSPVAVVAHGPHPNAGQLLMDYLMSAEGQKLLVDNLGSYSARSDVPSPMGMPKLADMKLVDVDWQALQGDSGAAIARYTAILKAGTTQ
ncbi:MAG TPA: extracellular solute-binding protein [Casimicrobiaceae bacterium]|nr:extracellular solute-binding protein [Casimicrobiaceae bacterium]